MTSKKEQMKSKSLVHSALSVIETWGAKIIMKPLTEMIRK